MSEIVYLDFNATTPISPEVAEKMTPFLGPKFGNPSSGHAYGAAVKRDIDEARENVAQLVECSADEVIFTSGATESINFGANSGNCLVGLSS